MSKNKITYTLYEGTLLTEAPIFDQSVNVLRFRDPEDNEYTILVNRAFLAEDQTLAEFCESQMSFMTNTMPAFAVEGKQLTSEIGPAKLPVVQIGNRFYLEGQLMKQVQTMVALPYHPVINGARRNVIIFTLSAEKEFTEYQRKHYVQLINSFDPEAATLNSKL
ncbi:DcrB-related protein [Erwinia mallotivora]|uniref:T6SS protein Cts1W n=1 Tax=Erwinia mallotivora TaxID=69222 RepID=A0A014MF01_9GAMM|nr:DcrB-related protein [Erwinia mallotivora]EXU76644.1 T6SS protein Cts1W [Erwinia mallotivora]